MKIGGVPMKLLHFKRENQIRLGIKTEKGILDIQSAGQQFNVEVPGTVDELIQKSQLSTIKKIVESASQDGFSSLYLQEKDITFESAVLNPQKILCIGLNYMNHIEETKDNVPKTPVLFSKFNNALAAHGEKITFPKISKEVDYEAELVIVIGKEAKNVEEKDALSYVFGYTVGNDFSARDLQFLTGQWLIGKTLDGFAPVGPYVITAEEIDPNDLKIQSKVNGEIRQDSNTKYMIFNCATIISYISKHMTLKPGDIIFTGTPEGVTLGHTKEGKKYLKPRDEIEVTIENIGTLKNNLI